MNRLEDHPFLLHFEQDQIHLSISEDSDNAFRQSSVSSSSSSSLPRISIAGGSSSLPCWFKQLVDKRPVQ